MVYLKSFVKSSIVLCLSLSLFACAKQNRAAVYQDPNSADEQTAEAQFVPEARRRNVSPKLDTVVTQAMLFAKNGKIYCNSNDCHPSVVMVSVAAGNAVSRCSGVLIGEDYVMTNDHCLDKSDAVVNGVTCEERIYIHLLGVNGGDQRTVSCKKIIYQSGQRGIYTKDYAIFQLKEKIKDRAPLLLSSKGFESHESAIMYKIHPTAGNQGSLDGIQQKANCYAAPMTMLYPDAKGKNSPLMTFGNCSTEKGNSGSPVLSADGKLAALAQGYLYSEMKPLELAQLQELGIAPISNTLMIATQLRCMTYLSPTTAAECEPLSSGNAFFPKDYINQYSGIFSENIQHPPTALANAQEWVRLNGYSSYVTNYAEAPTCISAADAATRAPKNYRVMMYRSTINQNFEVQWVPATFNGGSTIVSVPFNYQSVYAGEAHLLNAQFGELVVPVCN